MDRNEDCGESDPGRAIIGLRRRVGFAPQVRRVPTQRLQVFDPFSLDLFAGVHADLHRPAAGRTRLPRKSEAEENDRDGMASRSHDPSRSR